MYITKKPPGEELWAIEVKRTMTPKIERSFHSACADLNAEKRSYVYPGTERFPLDDKTNAIGVVELAKTLQSVQLGAGHKTGNAAVTTRKSVALRSSDRFRDTWRLQRNKSCSTSSCLAKASCTLFRTNPQLVDKLLISS
jgi:hypothetical protein